MILLVSDRTKWRREIAQRVFDGGIYLFCASYENAVFTVREKDTGGVIMDGIPAPEKAALLAEELRNRYPEMPLSVVLTPTVRALEIDLPFPVECILREANTDLLCAELKAFCARCGWRGEHLQTFELSLGMDPVETLYMGYPFPLSPREHAILRCLFYRAPELTASDDLMSLCYPGEYKSISTLAPLIHEINRRALKFAPRPLIVNVYGKGYRIRDGILER